MFDYLDEQITGSTKDKIPFAGNILKVIKPILDINTDYSRKGIKQWLSK